MKQKASGLSRVSLSLSTLGVFLFGVLSPMFLLQPIVNAAGCSPAQTFKTVWKTDNPGDGNNTSITIPTSGAGYNYQVDINGDGDFADIVGAWDETAFNTGNVSIDFGAPGTYEIAVCGAFPKIYISNNGDYRHKIVDITQWGDNVWTSSMSGAFQGASNLVMSATDTPNLSNVTNMTSMFRGASSFNGDVSSWDTSNVVSMGSVFRDATSFNGDVGSWDISNVTTMTSMFNGSGLSRTNYDALLIGWAAQSRQAAVTLDATGLQYCSAASARQAIVSGGWTINDNGAGCYFITNSSGVDPVDAGTGQSVELGETGTEPSDSRLIRLLDASLPLAEVSVTFSSNHDWSGVSGEVDAGAYKSVVDGLAGAPGVAGAHTLYVPKASEHDLVVICPNAENLSDVTADCNGKQSLTASSPNVSIVTISGDEYWKVDGLTGTGGLSLGQATSGENGLSETGLNTVAISLAGFSILMMAIVVFQRHKRYSTR